MYRKTSKRGNFTLPAIDPAAVKRYLARDFSSYEFLKEAPQEELAAECRALGFRFVTDPRPAQLACYLIAAQEPEFLFFLDMGAGKSKLFLDLLRWRKSRKELHRGLILVPEFVHITSWEEQFKRHAPDLSYRLLVGSKEERYEEIDKKSDVCLMNYKGLEVYMSKRNKVKKKDGGSENRQHVNQDHAAEFASEFNFVVYDEFHHLRTHKSLLFRLCMWLSAGCAFRYGSTGTPFGRDPIMLWPQFNIIDQGETLAALGMFRAVFFDAKKNYFGGYTYDFREEMMPELRRVIRNRSITYDEKDLKSQLPAHQIMPVPVRLSTEGQMYYDRIVNKMKEARGDYASLDNVFIRMWQCASGFLCLRADDESRIEVEIDPNPKLEAVRSMLEDLPGKEKVLLFYFFKHSGAKLGAMLDAAKIKWTYLRGQMKDSDIAKNYHQFLGDPKTRVFLLQVQVGSEAINPQEVCRYEFVYECPNDPILWQQLIKRVSRPGQTRPSFTYVFFGQGTVEAKIFKYAQEGKSLMRAVLSGKETLE